MDYNAALVVCLPEFIYESVRLVLLRPQARSSAFTTDKNLSRICRSVPAQLYVIIRTQTEIGLIIKSYHIAVLTFRQI